MQVPPARVLIVEDDVPIADLLQNLLEENGYLVERASTGVEALDRMRGRATDLVLLDLMLPDMDGWAFLRVREAERDLAQVPVLVVSAAGPQATAEAQALGAPFILSKPFDVDTLLDRIARLCTEPVRQCAWCGQVMDEAGEFRLPAGRKLRWATHGICPVCKRRERATIVD